MKKNLAGVLLVMTLFSQCGMNLSKNGKPFIDLSKDELLYPENISRFLDKLGAMRGKDSLLRIIQIGDSHIQMGHFSGEVREMLQARFGGSGLGFFFPNGLCKGYNPESLNIFSSGSWECEKITNMEALMPLGLVGMAMQTHDSAVSVTVGFKGEKERVQTVSILHAKLSGNYTILCDGAIVETIDFSEKTAITTLTLSKASETMEIRFVKKQGSKIPMVIYGLSVNTPAKSGVDYNAFGVSGGQYKYFAKNTPLLPEQVAAFKPDLVIISLGSNDSYDKNLTEKGYREMLQAFVAKMRAASPGTEFLLTTPPDTQFEDGKPVSISIVNNSILETGKKNQCAVWDFYTVMGGFDAIKKWQELELGNKDGLHLSTKGYYLQGQLFTLALARALEQKHPRNGWLSKVESVVNETLR